MLLEQEIASIMTFALNNANNPSPYYYNIPESFQYPAMYFPQPEITTAAETFLTYALKYAWYINIFCATREDAFELAWDVLTAIKKSRNLIPLIDEDGNETGELLRLDDPSAQIVDECAAQLTITWTSRRPYSRTLEDNTPMTTYVINGAYFAFDSGSRAGFDKGVLGDIYVSG